MQTTRPTFIMVRESQNKLKFQFLEKLIEKNEVLDAPSREVFFDEIGVSCLGLEEGHRFWLGGPELHLNGACDMGDLSTWVRKFCDFRETKDGKQEVFFQGKNIRIDNRVLWRNLMVSLYKPFALALSLSLKSSAEIQSRESSSYGFKTGKQIKE